VAGVKVYPTEYFCPKNYRTGVLKITPNSYTIHHYDGSWFDDWRKEVQVYTLKLYKTKGYNSLSRLNSMLFYVKQSFKNLGFINGWQYWLGKIIKK